MSVEAMVTRDAAGAWDEPVHAIGGVTTRAAAVGAAVPNATLVRRVDLTPSVARFWIRPDDGVPRFEPGQYLALGLLLDGHLLQRPYSTASVPGPSKSLEFLIRRVASGALTPRLWTLPVGARVRIGKPKGLFVLRSQDPRAHLFIATGTGLAPMRSMLETVLSVPDGGIRPSAVVVHGVAYVAELAYRDELARRAETDPRLRYIPVVSRPAHPDNREWTGLTGRIDGILASVCERSAVDPDRTIAYLCGNPEAITAATAALVACGFPTAAIIVENYWPVAVGAPRAA
ncbi:MAG: FAD-binding oxidoreductase [Candidatus Limnocylindrales bacterium]